MSLSVQVSFYEGQVCFSCAPGSAAILPDSIQRAHSFPFVLEEARVREDKSALLVPEGREGLRPQVPGWSQGSWLRGPKCLRAEVGLLVLVGMPGSGQGKGWGGGSLVP